MKFADALRLAKQGYEIRHPGMGPGWCHIWERDVLWAVNPITGSRTGQLTEDDKLRTDWARLQKDGGP